jgi:hypothetical protein
MIAVSLTSCVHAAGVILGSGNRNLLLTWVAFLKKDLIKRGKEILYYDCLTPRVFLQ